MEEGELVCSCLTRREVECTVAAAENVSTVDANHQTVDRSMSASSSSGAVRNVRCERKDESGRSRGEE